MWRAVAQENFEVASRLRVSANWRSCASRAYYVAFSRVTGVLLDHGVTPRVGLGTWSHATLPDIIRIHLLDRSASVSNLAYAVGRLYKLRLWADYRPEVDFAKRAAFESTGLMCQVFRQLGGRH